MPDRFENRLQFFEDLVIPEPHDPEALRLKPGRSSFVLFDPLGMLPAVQFHDQPGLETNEVGDVGADRGLPAELLPGRAGGP